MERASTPCTLTSEREGVMELRSRLPGRSESERKSHQRNENNEQGGEEWSADDGGSAFDTLLSHHHLSRHGDMGAVHGGFDTAVFCPGAATS